MIEIMEQSINEIIESDLKRYGSKTSILKVLFSPSFHYTGFKFLYFWRKASARNSHFLKQMFYKAMVRRLSYKYGFQIPVNTKIGKGFYIGHFGAIVINKNATIGTYCNITHGVTIGRTNRGKLKGCPHLGHHVWIGAGAVIVGKLKIGNNVLIAPNAFVNQDVPDNSLVLGNLSKIIARENPTQGYINNIS